MQGCAASAIVNLVTTGCARGAENGFLGLGPNGREEHQVADLLRNIVVFLLVSKTPRHAAASGRDESDIVTGHQF